MRRLLLFVLPIIVAGAAVACSDPPPTTGSPQLDFALRAAGSFVLQSETSDASAVDAGAD